MGDSEEKLEEATKQETELRVAHAAELVSEGQAFLDSRNNRRSTTLYELTKRVELACRFLEKSPKPKNAKDLFLIKNIVIKK